MDIQAMKAKLAQLNKKRGNSTIWKPAPGTTQIRALPLKGNSVTPFQELYFHYSLGGKTYLSPLSYGDPDPIAEFSDALIGEGGLSKEDYKKAKKFSPQVRTYLPIIVRGKEEEGVKFWGFGKSTYKELLSIIDNPDYGDITDPDTGRDLTITFTDKDKNNANSFPETKVVARVKETPLHPDKDVRNKLLTEQPVLLDEFTKHTYAELEEVLAKYIDPSASPAAPTPKSAPSVPAAAPAASEDGWATGDTPAKPEPEAPKAVGTGNTDDDFTKLFNEG